MCNRCSYLAILFAVIIAGCAPATLQRAVSDGRAPLTSQELFDLVSGNSLALNAFDFSGFMFFSANGGLSAIDNLGQKDIGAWDISSENRLCLKFQKWYYGDLKCYSIVPDTEEGSYSFFTSNGAAYYSAKQQPGDSQALGNALENSRARRFLRQQLAGEKQDTGMEKPAVVEKQSQTAAPSMQRPVAVQPSQGDASSTTRRLARQCPGCNLSGADLKEADLVGADLAGANLAGADLRYSNLRRANLAGANLAGARLNHTNLPGANLRDCNLRNADLSGANLLLADFTGADLTGAKLDGAYIENTIGLEKP